MALSQVTLEAQRDALQTAMNQGVRIVKFDDGGQSKEIVYRSFEEMQQTLDSINAQLGTLTNAAPTRGGSVAWFAK